MFRILLVEDDPPTRDRLAGIVRANHQLELAAALGERAASLEWLAANAPPRVLLVDLELPDGSGVDVIRELRRRAPEADAMVISVFGDESHVLTAIEAGATGYLLKDETAEGIGAAVLRLIAGESPISSAIARHLLRRFHAAPAAAGAAPAAAAPAATGSGTAGTAGGVSALVPVAPYLTPRETEVLQLVAKGLSYDRMAETLGMKPTTITSHIKQIYRKLEVRSRGEAVFEALQLGLVKPPPG